VCLLFTTYLDKRWNYSYICLSRLLEYYAIVVELTSKISKNDIPGIESEKIEALRKHFFKKHEWILAQALEEILAPFYTATKMLSIRTRQTGGDGYIVLKQLKLFLETASSSNVTGIDDDETKLSSWRHELNELKTETYFNAVNFLKQTLLRAFNLYTKKHISAEMTQALLVIFF
jgi:hypothetical protein